MRISNYICLSCRGKLQESAKDETTCSDCDKPYLRINDIPILVEDSITYINETYISLKCHIKNSKEYIDINREMFPFQKGRAVILNRIAESYEENLNIYEQMSESLKKHIDPEYTLNSDINKYNGDPLIGKELFYLVRDWGYSKESENEIDSIFFLIQKLIKEFTKLNNILFIGCGTGRFAFETSQIAKNVFCSDLSYRMMYFLEGILKQKTFNIREINDSNIYSAEDVTRNINAKAQNDFFDIENINYFISDVRKLPLENDSMNAIASIYFLDVMNIENYIQEISRVLEKDGVFINIGPIGYPYSNFVHKLLPTEIKEIFFKNNFEIVFEDFLECTYMDSDIKLTKTIHKNWVFVARKKEKKTVTSSIHSVLSITNSIFVEKKEELNNNGRNTFESNLITKSGHIYENADLMIEIFTYIDGKKSLKEIVEIISENFELEFEINDLLAIINKLIEDNTLELVN